MFGAVVRRWSAGPTDKCEGAILPDPALLPIFANPASIVLNSSINAHIGMPMSAIYAASKRHSAPLSAHFSAS
jgi:hypothetical protein